jgi:hypothetical protein
MPAITDLAERSPLQALFGGAEQNDLDADL